MNEIFLSILLGIIEGITEFIPVSSTGHLILADHWLGFMEKVGKEKAECFIIVVQLAAILAVVILYRERFKGLFYFKEKKGLKGFNGLYLLGLTSLPGAVLGVLFSQTITTALWKPRWVATALLVGALGILITEKFSGNKEGKTKTLDELNWKQALGIGFFQCIALWPGISRSASTIIGGMFFKLDRKNAAIYSFFAAVPIMIGASGKELLDNSAQFTSDDIAWFSLGCIVSFITAWFAIKTFIKLLSKFTLEPFAYYRIVFAIFIFWALWGQDTL
jgi:undecaprenyl-diphosphatase